MEHYRKFKVQKSNSDFNCDSYKSQNLIPVDFEAKGNKNLKSSHGPEEGRAVSSMRKIDQIKRSQSSDFVNVSHGLHDTSFSYEFLPAEEEDKRNQIYDNQSFKETQDQLNQTTIEQNNEIFEMVFLNKPKFKETLSTQASFSKNKQLEKQKQKNQMNIYQFQLGKKLGAGKFGEVFVARHVKTGFLCALKRIDKCNIDHKLVIQLIREIKIQSFLNHPNIVKLYTFFSDQRYIYLVMELCCSGQLYGFLKKKRKLPEDLAKAILKDTLKALDYMHEREIIHRDLKPENIIYHNGMIKLCDFGWSISSKTMRQTFCGTPLYVSPQLLKRKNYNNKIDVWSIGILTYELLFGKVPFDITTERDFIKIVEDEIRFSKATPISNEAKDFILICLKKDPRDRYTVAELLEHPFIANVEPVPMGEMF